MTTPDVSALAAALSYIHSSWDAATCLSEAEAIIAALRPQGGRITPLSLRERGVLRGAESRDEIDRHTHRPVAPEDDPVSAQAAPDNHLTMYLEGRDDIDRTTYGSLLAMGREDEQAAVRAALEGLQRDIIVLPWWGAPSPHQDDEANVMDRDMVLHAIDARLAALDD